MPLLSVSNLGVSYERTGQEAPALAGVHLAISRGERLAVIGESGSGKSTLALAIAGLLPPTARISGSIAWPGLSHPARNGADIGFVFQDAGGTLDPVMSVGRQIAEVVWTHRGMSRTQARDQAIALLDRVRLPDPVAIFGAYPHQLSGGQRQRVGIATAIAGDPVLLIADEPTSALDTIVQSEIMSLVDMLVRETGLTLLLISHDIALAAVHSDHIMVMRRGVTVEFGTTPDIVHHPQNAYTQSLLASVLTLPPTNSRSDQDGSEARA